MSQNRNFPAINDIGLEESINQSMPNPKASSGAKKQQKNQSQSDQEMDDDDDINDANNSRNSENQIPDAEQNEDKKENDDKSLQNSGQKQDKDKNKQNLIKPKEQQEKQNFSATSMFVDTKRFVVQQRSNFISMRHRNELEQNGILGQIKSGQGPFGNLKVDLLELKKQICDLNDQLKLPQNDDLLKKLDQDGLYIDNSFLFKNSDINVQKLEERILKNGQKEYFKANGEIKIDNDLLAKEIT